MEPKSVEKVYQKKSQLEHILLRPDSYVGSTDEQSQRMWVFDDKTQRMALRQISYVPALYKIFGNSSLSHLFRLDEVLVNAADNYQRDKRMSSIKVTLDEKSG